LAKRDPFTVGLKVTVMPQEFPVPTLGIHVFVWKKSPGSAPAILTALMFSVPAPVLVSVVVRGRLVAPTRTVPNDRFAGTSFTVPTVRVMVAPVVLVGSVTEVAVRVTMALAGTVGGAV